MNTVTFPIRQENLSGRDDTYHEEVDTSELKNCLLSTNETSAEPKLTCHKTKSSYHVPNYCNVPVGSALYYRPIMGEGEFQTVIKGLAIQSQDCTFTLATDVSKHTAWINSVVFGSKAY